jgi:type IV pilus assembly protein PilO
MASLYPRTQREQLLVLLGIVGLGIAAVFWYLRYDPRTVELDALEERIVALDFANRRAKAVLARGSVEELRAEGAMLADALDQMRPLVPAGNEVPVLLEQISTAARRVGLDISSVEPLAVEQGADFDAYRYRFRLAGNYHTITDFLTRVASLPRIVAPINVTFALPTATAAPRPGATPLSVAASFELQTYVTRANAATPGGAP